MSPELFPTAIESERLRYDPFHETVDTLDLYEHHRSGEMDEVLRSLGDEPHRTPKRTFDDISAAETAWESGERATYAMTDRERDEFVGVAELWLEWERDWAAFGIWLREPFWGQGYSGERAGAMCYVAFDLLDLGIVSVGLEPENERSNRAIKKYVERFGGQYDGLLRNWLPPGDGGGSPRDLAVFTISQEQWRTNVTDAELATFSVER